MIWIFFTICNKLPFSWITKVVIHITITLRKNNISYINLLNCIVIVRLRLLIFILCFQWWYSFIVSYHMLPYMFICISSNMFIILHYTIRLKVDSVLFSATVWLVFSNTVTLLEICKRSWPGFKKNPFTELILFSRFDVKSSLSRKNIKPM